MISETEPTLYKFAMNVKLNKVHGNTLINQVFPNVEDLMIASRKFQDFEVALNSVNTLCSELATSLNTAVKEDRYGMLSEVNPKHSEQETMSKDWDEFEIAKIWIYDKILREQTKGPLKAVGLAQVHEVFADPVSLN